MKNINNIISIVTPTRNSEKYLEETILSVITQKGDFQIDYIVIDNNSTDNTLNIIKKYEDLINNQKIPMLCQAIDFKWLSEKDNGMYEAINKGFKLSKGDIMSYLNSDDKLITGSLQAVMKIFRQYDDIDWLTGLLTWLNKKGALYKVINIYGYKQKYLQKGYYHYDYLHFVQSEGTFWTRKLWHNIGEKINEKYKLAGDYDLWMRFSIFCKLYTVHASLCGYRKHREQLTANPESYEEELKEICRISPNLWEKFWFLNYKIYKNLPEKLKNKINYQLPYLVFDLENNKWIKKN